MKHYGYTAREASAWCRVCRPGSVVGPQQQYLETKQDQMWAEGRRYRQEGGGRGGTSRLSAGRQRPRASATTGAVSGSGEVKKKRPHKSFTTIEESVTSRLLHRIQQEGDGCSASVSSQGAGAGGWGDTEDGARGSARKSQSSKNLIPNKSERLGGGGGGASVPHQRPSTTENGTRQSAERSDFKKQFEGQGQGQGEDTAAGVKVAAVARKSSRGSVGSTAALSQGSSGSSGLPTRRAGAASSALYTLC